MNVLDLLLKSTFIVKVIISILLILSILSWSIIIHRTRILNIAVHEAKMFEDQFWSGIELSCLYQIIEGHREKINGFERIFYSGFKEFCHLHNANKSIPEVALKGAGRVMRISINREIESLENQVPFLGTVGSISPYIGLLGTVWGIMHAFTVFGSVKQVTLQMIAPGIAESLIATAIGLLVAIPAVIAYNRLNQRIDNLALNYDNFMEEVMAILHRKAFLLDNIELNKG